MKTTIFALLSLCIGQVALAQSVPVLRQGQCPTGTVTSGNSCIPVGGTQQVFYNGGGPCPLGFVSSKLYCVK